MKPMIRFGTPVFDGLGQKKGIVLLNYFGANLFRKFEDIDLLGGSQSLLLNREGYFLKGRGADDEWGFMYPDRQDRTFARANPEAWGCMMDSETGQFETSESLQ